jgi:hypothetical protein
MIAIEAVYKLMKKGLTSGTLDVLANEVGEDLMSEMFAMGYVYLGLSVNGDTWNITPKAKERAVLLYGRPTKLTMLWDKIMDWFYVHIFKVDLRY